MSPERQPGSSSPSSHVRGKRAARGEPGGRADGAGFRRGCARAVECGPPASASPRRSPSHRPRWFAATAARPRGGRVGAAPGPAAGRDGLGLRSCSPCFALQRERGGERAFCTVCEETRKTSETWVCPAAGLFLGRRALILRGHRAGWRTPRSSGSGELPTGRSARSGSPGQGGGGRGKATWRPRLRSPDRAPGKRRPGPAAPRTLAPPGAGSGRCRLRGGAVPGPALWGEAAFRLGRRRSPPRTPRSRGPHRPHSLSRGAD